MPLTLNTGYENIFYDVVLDGLRDILISEFNYGKIYIAPEIVHKDPFSIKLWGTNAETVEFTIREWQKTYNVDITIFAIEQNPNENFYKQLYQDAERINQLIHNNQTKTITVDGRNYTWIGAQIEDIEVLSEEDTEGDIDGLHSVNLEFSCLVSRES